MFYFYLDFPCILSGGKVSFHDPLEHHGEECWEYDLAEECADDPYFIHDHWDQFNVFNLPIHAVMSAKNLTQYRHTLFRFPLRQRASKLAETVYDKTRIDELFQMFEQEGHLALLFLKNIEKIQLYKRHVGVYSAEVLQLRGTRKQEFLENVDLDTWAAAPQCITNVMGIQTGVNGGRQSNSKWLVIHYYAGGADFSSHMKTLFRKSKNLPLVGIAFCLDDKKARERIQYTEGHVFCFLPLPLEERCMSGLPFHVNGFFAVDHNRRHLKYASLDQNMTWCEDKDVLWNQCLMKEVLPKALVQLVEEAVRLQLEGRLSVRDVYRLIPNIAKVTQHWKPLVESFFSQCFQNLRVFHICDGRWLYYHQVLFLEEEDRRIAGLLTRILACAGKYVSDPPGHVLRSLLKYVGRQNIAFVKPSDTRSALRRNQQLQDELSTEDKLHLLDHVLKCLEKFENLNGLKLVPLADGSFGSFNSGEMYFPCLDHPAELLPGFERMLVDVHKLKQWGLLQRFEHSVVGKGICKLLLFLLLQCSVHVKFSFTF
jgi:sacsin